MDRGFEMAGSERLSDREARAATNQTRFRRLNARSDRASGADVPASEWFCECVNTICAARITMRIDAYEAIREVANRFFVAASDQHFQPDLERVIEHNARYWVVEQAGAGPPPAPEPVEPDPAKVPLHFHT
jgi:hypothetical protein